MKSLIAIAALLLAIVVFPSCGHDPIGHGTEYVLESSSGSDTSQFQTVIQVLEKRLDNFGISGDYELSRRDDKIVVRVRSGIISDHTKMYKLLQTSARLTFRTVYTFGEIAPMFSKAQDTWVRMHHIDSADARNAGFSPLLVSSGNDANGGMIFGCKAKDTLAVMNILRTDSIAMLFPSDVVFHWGTGYKLDNGEPSFNLYACKNGKSDAMDGNYVSSAESHQDNTSSQYEVGVTFNDDGAKEFARITKANIARPLAIELDDFVYSAPTVNDEITGGKAEITGNFTVKEAEDLANILNAGYLPVRLLVVEVNQF